MKYDFSKAVVKSLDGEVVKDAHKPLANAIYGLTKDLDLVEKAVKINKGEAVELDKTEVESIKAIILDEKASFFAFVKKAFIDYIASVKE